MSKELANYKLGMIHRSLRYKHWDLEQHVALEKEDAREQVMVATAVQLRAQPEAR